MTHMAQTVSAVSSNAVHKMPGFKQEQGVLQLPDMIARHSTPSKATDCA